MKYTERDRVRSTERNVDRNTDRNSGCRKPDCSCGCNNGEELAVAYVPEQVYGETFNPLTALNKGTLFPDLYRSYYTKKGCDCR